MRQKDKKKKKKQRDRKNKNTQNESNQSSICSTLKGDNFYYKQEKARKIEQRKTERQIEAETLKNTEV